jgi:hypothetical protein
MCRYVKNSINLRRSLERSLLLANGGSLTAMTNPLGRTLQIRSCDGLTPFINSTSKDIERLKELHLQVRRLD